MTIPTPPPVHQPDQRVSWATSQGRTPQTGTVFVALYRLLLRSVATRGRLIAIAALATISTSTALITRLIEPDDQLGAALGFVNSNLTTLVPVAVLLFGSATIGDLIDDGSLVYLWLRPVPSWLPVAAAWAATVTIALPLVGVPVLLATALIHVDGELLVATLVGLLVAISAYAALFVTGGIRFRRALPWGLAYILIWEGFVARAGETASKLALRSYTRSILAEITGRKLDLGEFTLASGILVPLVVGALLLWYATRRLAKTDVA